jgi:hypothetical protein
MLRFLTLPAFAGLVHGVAFSAPQPTTVEDDLARGLTGWSPKPTSGPLELFRRDEAGPRTCGWYDDGFDTQTVTCPTGTCMLYTPSGIVGMAGCCTSTVGGIDYQNCGWVNKCYDYLDVNAGYCDDNCMTNEFIRVCTDSDMPYCQSWTCMCALLIVKNDANLTRSCGCSSRLRLWNRSWIDLVDCNERCSRLLRWHSYCTSPVCPSLSNNHGLEWSS